MVKSAQVKEHRENMVREHPLEREFGLTAFELLDALKARFRARVTLEGAVAEVQMENRIRALVGTLIERYQVYDIDGHPDFGIWLSGSERRLLAECKNVRDNRKGTEAYREGGKPVAYKAETQKTRDSKGDPTSRFYGVDQFDILGVCLGKKTGNWADFMFARAVDLARHAEHKGKLVIFQRVPLAGEAVSPWYESLEELLAQWHKPRSTRRS